MTNKERRTAAFALREMAKMLDVASDRDTSTSNVNTVVVDGETIDISFGDIGPGAMGLVPVYEQIDALPEEVQVHARAVSSALDDAIATETMVRRNFDRGTMVLGNIRQLLPLVLGAL